MLFIYTENKLECYFKIAFQENNSKENPKLNNQSPRETQTHCPTMTTSEHVPLYLLCQGPERKNKEALNPEAWLLLNSVM